MHAKTIDYPCTKSQDHPFPYILKSHWSVSVLCHLIWSSCTKAHHSGSNYFIMFNLLSSKITNYFLTVTLITENWCFHLYLKLQYAVEMDEICSIPNTMLPSYWQNTITQLIGRYVAVWYQLGPHLFSCWQCRSWSTSVRPFSMFYYLSQENGHSVDVLGNSKAQMLGSHVYLFSNRSHMEISA